MIGVFTLLRSNCTLFLQDPQQYKDNLVYCLLVPACLGHLVCGYPSKFNKTNWLEALTCQYKNKLAWSIEQQSIAIVFLSNEEHKSTEIFLFETWFLLYQLLGIIERRLK